MWRDLRLVWDRALGWLFIAAGAVALVAGWLGVSRSNIPAEQIPYVLSGGIGGLFLLGLGAVLLLSADLRDEWTKLDELDVTIQQADGSAELVEKTEDEADDEQVRPVAVGAGGVA